MTLKVNLTQGDCSQLVALIGSVYREYQDRLWLAGADRDLANLPHAYLGPNKQLAVLVGPGQRVFACLAWEKIGPDLATLKRFYVCRNRRREGAGRRLLEWAEGRVAQHDCRQIRFWSDRRFRGAHAFFRAMGFRQLGPIRSMNDGWKPYQEIQFEKRLR